MIQGLTYSVTNNTYVDFTKFKMDEHNEIKQILFITSGYPAEFSSSGSANRIWSHKSSFSTSRCHDQVDSGVVSSGNGFNITYTLASAEPAIEQTVKVNGYLVTNGCFGDGGDGDDCPNGARIGVVAHEMGHGNLHGLSVLDYYEVANGALTSLPGHCGGSGSGKGIDSWGIMGDSWGACGDQLFPPMMSAWTKMQLGWSDPIVADGTSATTHELVNAQMCPDVLKVTHGYPDTEFMLYEVRDKVSFDSALPGQGVLAFHLDETGGTGYTSHKNKHPNYGSVDDGTDHYYYRVEQADGADNLECGSGADEGDLLGVGASLTNKARGAAGWQSTHGYHGGVTFSATHTLTVVARASKGWGTGTNVTVTTDSFSTPTPLASQYPLTCTAGQYGRRDGSCASCPVGKYSMPGALCVSGCQVCPDGTYSDSTGATECTVCPIGTYDDITHYPSNSSSCKACPALNQFAETETLTGSTRSFTCDGGGCTGMLPLMTETMAFCTRGGSYANCKDLDTAADRPNPQSLYLDSPRSSQNDRLARSLPRA